MAQPPATTATTATPQPARAAGFDYERAFDRNIGWVTAAEQGALRGKRVAIAGMGGVGGVHLLTLARLGIGRFHVADFDRFDLPNFNRQAGATMSALGRPKAEVLHEMCLDIDPEAEVRVFAQGISAANVGEFLAGVDLYVDGLDFFAFDARRQVFAHCHARGIPAVTVAPLGMGAALMVFLPGQMSFEDYFGWADADDYEKALRMAVGIAPARLHMGYLVDPSRVSLAARRAPSTIMACQICAGVAGTEALKILLGRGTVRGAPHGMQFDAFTHRLSRTWRPGGHRNPLQQLALAVGRRMLARQPAATEAPRLGASCTTAGAEAGSAVAASWRPEVARVMDRARWAPSGDNAQPWRFEAAGPERVVVHGFDTRSHCVYDLEGHASQLALGALLENVQIAAAAQGLAVGVVRRHGLPDETPTFELQFSPCSTDPGHALSDCIERRAVQRRPLSTRRLSAAEKARVEASVGPGYSVSWLETLGQRARVAKLVFTNAKVRLTMPEAFEVHRSIIDWGARFSEDRLPEQALGANPMTTAIMRRALASWERVQFANRYLAGTWGPRIEMDLLPALACGAHMVIRAARAPETVDDFVAAGRAVQRAWLTLTALGLWQQPEMTPLIFGRYVRRGVAFTGDAAVARLATLAASRLPWALEGDAEPVVWLGRVGAGPAPVARSIRKPLGALMLLPGNEPSRP